MARELRPHERIIPPSAIDHDQLLKTLQQRLYQLESTIKKLQRDIPIFVDESLYMQNSATLTLLPQSQNLELITTIIAIVTSAGGATLTLGRRTFPLGQGNLVIQLPGNGMLLNNGDTRQLVQSSAGLLGLELLGVELPDKGVF